MVRERDAGVVDEDVDMTGACLSGPLDQVLGRFEVAQVVSLTFALPPLPRSRRPLLWLAVHRVRPPVREPAAAQCYRAVALPFPLVEPMTRVVLPFRSFMRRVVLRSNWVVRPTLAAPNWVVNPKILHWPMV